MSDIATQADASRETCSGGDITAPSERRDVPSSRVAKTYHLLLLILSCAVLLAAAILETAGDRAVRLPVFNVVLPETCYWRMMTGVNCPGCGLTRCFISLAHGQFARALSFNAVGVALFCGVLFQVPFRSWQLWRISRGRGEFDLAVPSMILIALVAALIIQWVVRVVL